VDADQMAIGRHVDVCFDEIGAFGEGLAEGGKRILRAACNTASMTHYVGLGRAWNLKLHGRWHIWTLVSRTGRCQIGLFV
jgi:hypothetical protein